MNKKIMRSLTFRASRYLEGRITLCGMTFIRTLCYFLVHIRSFKVKHICIYIYIMLRFSVHFQLCSYLNYCANRIAYHPFPKQRENNSRPQSVYFPRQEGTSYWFRRNAVISSSEPCSRATIGDRSEQIGYSGRRLRHLGALEPD